MKKDSEDYAEDVLSDFITHSCECQTSAAFKAFFVSVLTVFGTFYSTDGPLLKWV